MSVLKSRRGDSGMQFLENAYNLEVYTIRQCLKFPKRYTFFITTEMARLASSCHEHAKAANSIYPTNAHEAQMRRDHLIEANNDVQNLLSKIDIARSLFSIEANVIEAWVEMAVNEASLLSGVRQADKKRYADLK